MERWFNSFNLGIQAELENTGDFWTESYSIGKTFREVWESLEKLKSLWTELPVLAS